MFEILDLSTFYRILRGCAYLKIPEGCSVFVVVDCYGATCTIQLEEEVNGEEIVRSSQPDRSKTRQERRNHRFSGICLLEGTFFFIRGS